MQNHPTIRRLLTLALILTLAGITGARATFAQAIPVGTIVDLSTYDYAQAPQFSSDWRVLEAGSTTSVAFDYTGRNRPVMVWMEISTVGTDLEPGSADGPGFEIWTLNRLEQAAAGEEVEPVGIGLPLQPVTSAITVSDNVTDNVTSGVIGSILNADEDDEEATDTTTITTATTSTSGSIELFWYINLPAPQTFVVVMSGDATEDINYMMNISGPGLDLPDGFEPTVVATADDEGQETPIIINATLPSADDTNIATVLATFLNVRQGPSLESPILTTVPLGTQVLVVGTDATTAWLAIQLEDDQIGWVSRGLTDFAGEVDIIDVQTGQPAPVPVPVTEAPATGEIATIVVAELNVRQGPTVDYPIITTLNEGAIVAVTGRNDDNTWIQVDLGDGRIGWVDRELTDYAGLAIVVEAPPLEEIVQAGVGGDEPVDADLAFVAAAALNLRAGPSTGFAVVTTLDQGAPLTVLGRNATNNWLLVETENGIQGWVTRTFVNFTGIAPEVEITQTAVTTPVVGGVIQPAANVATITGFGVNMRQGPSINFPVIATVSGGTVVGIIGANATDNWLLVELEDGTQGWITRGLTNYTGIAPVLETPALPVPVTETGEGVAQLPVEPEDADTAPAEEALGQNWFVLNENTTDWFTFSHPGNDEPIHIWMEVEPSEGAGFRIFDEEQAQAILDGANPDDFSAIGRGTPNPAEPGNLFWRGVFAEAGVYYVMVEHGWEGDVTYSVYAAGIGLE